MCRSFDFNYKTKVTEQHSRPSSTMKLQFNVLSIFNFNLESEWSDSFTFNHNFLQLFKLVFSFKVVAVVKSIPLFELISHLRTRRRICCFTLESSEWAPCECSHNKVLHFDLITPSHSSYELIDLDFTATLSPLMSVLIYDVKW